MMTLEQLTNVCNLMNLEGVEYVVVGGWAIFVHGYERATRDLDILISTTAKNIEKLKRALNNLLPEACSELELNDVEKNVVVRMVGDNLVIDLMAKIGEVSYKTAKDHVVSENVNGIPIPIADVDTMLKCKEGVREIDKKDYIFLLGKKRYLEKGEK